VTTRYIFAAAGRAIRAGDDVTARYIFAAAGRARLSSCSHASPRARSHKTSLRPSVRASRDPTSSTSTVSWLEITSGSGPCAAHNANDRPRPSWFRRVGCPDHHRARGSPGGARPGAPHGSRRRRSPQLDGLKSGRRRHQRRREEGNRGELALELPMGRAEGVAHSWMDCRTTTSSQRRRQSARHNDDVKARV